MEFLVTKLTDRINPVGIYFKTLTDKQIQLQNFNSNPASCKCYLLYNTFVDALTKIIK